jgi:hypothetical protein
MNELASDVFSTFRVRGIHVLVLLLLLVLVLRLRLLADSTRM